MRIESIDATPINLEFIPEVGPNMLRATTHGTALTLYRVQLDNGAIGYGDDVGSPRDPNDWIGQDAITALRHCRNGGVQMASFDAVGRALGVPAHVLMGRQVRSRVPFAYWSIDLPPAVFARQVERAASLGYTTYKFKARPWWDPIEQVAAAAEVAPKGFRVWLDFNGHLREARLALPILKQLAQFECVGGFESPIPQRDVEGYQILRRKIDRPIAAHYGGGCCHVVSDRGYDPGVSAVAQLRGEVCDGFVLGGGDVDQLRAIAGVAHEFRKPFWIQTVGTALRAVWVAHLASTCSEALLSSLAAHDLWAKDLAVAPRPVDGWLPVPDGPGLGIDVDAGAIERLRAASPTPTVRRVSTVVYPSGVRWSFANEQQRHEAFYFGHLPGFVPGVRLEVREDDRSADFTELYDRCASAPVVA
ncbi:MAG TPA: mandelate racemase/muconate lactonizing enzyme family protein [Chloroflexota bacterium]|nr:mandelate racemase/muconate lactonizing enzyme family protein [Chloroflexota bacterium]